MCFSYVLQVRDGGNNPDSVWGADSRKMYVMSPCFQTLVYPASIIDKHKAPQALIWACHEQPAAPAMQCFTNRCGGHISIQPDLFIGSHTASLSCSFLFCFCCPNCRPCCYLSEWVYKCVCVSVCVRTLRLEIIDLMIWCNVYMGGESLQAHFKSQKETFIFLLNAKHKIRVHNHIYIYEYNLQTCFVFSS